MDYQPLNVDKVKKTNYFFVINYVLFILVLVYMYIGYSNMLNTSEAITLVFLGDYFVGATSWWRPTNNGVYAVVDRKN